MNTEQELTFLQEALRTGAALGDVKTNNAHVRPHALVPADYQLVYVPDAQLAHPWRLKQDVTFIDTDSFLTYYADFATAHSRIFIDPNYRQPRIVGVLDYHEAQKTGHVATWNEHRLRFEFQETPEWTAWKSNDRKPLEQKDFAEFIEDNLPDIVHPSQADMMLIARTFEAKKDVQFGSAVRLANGEVQFKYSEELRGTVRDGAIEVPERFTIRLAPFVGVPPVQIDVLLRYTLRDKDLKLRYQLYRPHKVIEEAVRGVIDTIRAGVKHPDTVLLGTLPPA